MSRSPIPSPPKRGRPRSVRTEKAILRAASELVASSGLADMTIEGVADRAGVGKASIYRRWPSKGALAFDAVVDTILSTQPTPDTGSLEGDLLQVARTWIGGARGRRGGRTVAGLIAEVQSDPDLAAAWRGGVGWRGRRGPGRGRGRVRARGGCPARSAPGGGTELFSSSRHAPSPPAAHRTA